jgi:diacylglycerol O-acyltransferase
LNRFYPIGVVKNGVGLNITGFSYCGNLWATVVSCRKMMPDPEVFASCLNESFAALVAEVDREETGRLATADVAAKPRAGKLRQAVPAASQADPDKAPHHPVRARLSAKTPHRNA